MYSSPRSGRRSVSRNLLTSSPRKHYKRRRNFTYYLGWTIATGALLCAGQVLWRGKHKKKRSKKTVSKSQSAVSSRLAGLKDSFHHPEYRSKQEQDDRDIRFPSVDERVRLYMSNWYTPPCPSDQASFVQFNYLLDDDEDLDTKPKDASAHRLYIRELPSKMAAKPRLFELHGEVETDASLLFFLQERALKNCTYEACADVLQTIHPWVQQRRKSNRQTIPTLLDLGDKAVTIGLDPTLNLYMDHPHLPHLKKFRLAFSKQEINEMTVSQCVSGHRSLPSSTGFSHLQPILWKLKVSRHYGMLPNVTALDIPYAQKKNKAVFRGRLSGIHKEMITTTTSSTANDWKNCMGIPRCRLVLQHAKSSLIDARLVGPTKGLPTTLTVTHPADALHYASTETLPLFQDDDDEERMSLAAMLRYKAIIMMEGNDVASGLKWALYSNSVVLMDPVTVTSWAMEERLQAWVHYVPLHPNATDVEERFQWVLDNPVAAQRIARAGALWIKDLWFHPQAARDDAAIYAEMIRRYQAHFVLNPMLF